MLFLCLSHFPKCSPTISNSLQSLQPLPVLLWPSLSPVTVGKSPCRHYREKNQATRWELHHHPVAQLRAPQLWSDLSLSAGWKGVLPSQEFCSKVYFSSWTLRVNQFYFSEPFFLISYTSKLTSFFFSPSVSSFSFF